MHLTFQYRLNPNASDLRNLDEILEQDRTLYNAALQERIEAYRKAGKSISYNEQTRSLTLIRQDGFNGGAVRQRGALRRLDRAFKAFFRRVKAGEKPGFPRFKGKDRWDSAEIAEDYRIRDGRFFSADFPMGLKVKMHRPLPVDMEKHCGATLLRKAGKWLINLKIEVPTPEKQAVASAVGIDVGLHAFAATSDGRFFEAPRYFRRAEKNLRRKQRLLRRAKPGSNSRRKKRLMVARAFLKVANQRKDFHHKVSRGLADRYDLIAAEALNIKGMIRSRLSKSIADAGWGSFLDKIAYKAEGAGKHFVRVDPRGTSQICSTCGNEVPKPLSERTHSCDSCGLVADRDLNAAINIRKLGQSLLPSSHVRPSGQWFGTEYQGQGLC